jgi:RHS repeat-associated protein
LERRRIDYTYNAAHQLTSTTKSGQTTNYTYDGNGNQATAGSRIFTYNLADQLVSTANAGTTTTYAYDGDGRRVSSTVGGGGADLRYVWDPLASSGISELALERTPSGGLVRRYLGGPLGAVSMTNSAGTFYYHHDPLGTVSDVTDASGAAQWRYEYEAYGAMRSATDVSGSAPENRLRFNGQYVDSETDLYHLRARQYDSALGRFGALDPVELGVSEPYIAPYVYADGRPTTRIDPTGRQTITVCFWNALWGFSRADRLISVLAIVTCPVPAYIRFIRVCIDRNQPPYVGFPWFLSVCDYSQPRQFLAYTAHGYAARWLSAWHVQLPRPDPGHYRHRAHRATNLRSSVSGTTVQVLVRHLGHSYEA